MPNLSDNPTAAPPDRLPRMSAHREYVYVADMQGLTDLCAGLKGQSPLALDTEFIRERSYAPRLELVQVAAPDGSVAILDYGTIGRIDGDPFAKLICDPAVLKVLHAADQDLEMLYLLTGRVVGPIWDTQLTTGLFPYAGRLGYAALVEALLGVTVEKCETLTDWSRRPLTREQLHYAAADVRFLLQLYAVESQRLADLGRLTWAQEECERVRFSVETDMREAEDERLLFRRVRGWRGLGPETLAVLRELTVWRERTAREADRPRGSIMKDDILCAVARRAPTHMGQVTALRGIHPRDAERWGGALAEAVKRGRSVPPDERPVPAPDEARPEGAARVLFASLQAVVQKAAAEKGVAPALLATTADLSRLVSAHVRGEALDAAACPLSTGWRRELVGAEIQDVLTGRVPQEQPGGVQVL